MPFGFRGKTVAAQQLAVKPRLELAPVDPDRRQIEPQQRSAGFDHVGAAAGAKRGVVAGSLFGGFILIAYELRGEPAKAELPEPAILLIVLTTVLAVCFAALGGWMRGRAIRRGARKGAAEVPGPLG